MSTKRVLILTYYWPPSGGAGVQRWLKFAKYLPQHGWKPVVFVPEGANYPALDPKLESDVSPSIDIWKGPIVEPAKFPTDTARPVTLCRLCRSALTELA